MRYNYKIWPLDTPHPAFPNDKTHWTAVLNVKVSYQAKHSPPSVRFEALVDTGSADTLFHGSVGKAIGIKVESGIKSDLGGIAKNKRIDVYFHDVLLHVGADMIRIRAGFSDDLSVAGILGRRGFFEHFIVTFDPTCEPPGFEMTRVGRA